MTQRPFAALAGSFLGEAPRWYKTLIVGVLILNPLVASFAGPFAGGWVLLLAFILTLALALKCYPLQPGGLLVIEAVLLGLTSPAAVYAEIADNLPVLLLLIFMVAGIYFLRELIVYLFTRLFLGVRAKPLLALIFCGAAAVLSAFLDALTVIAVVITVATGLHDVYHRIASQPHAGQVLRADAEAFHAFLRSLVMHAAVGTALGGVCTLVGEPQNLLIGSVLGWDFVTFFRQVAPVALPVLVMGLATCLVLETAGICGYGARLPESVRRVLEEAVAAEERAHDARHRVRLWAQALTAFFLVLGLGLHLAEVGLIGLAVIVLATAFCGVIDERRLGHAFAEALPFTALLATFFAVVAVIHDQGLFAPIIEAVLAQNGRHQLVLMYLANGLLSSISDNVFVATVYISEVKAAFDAGRIGAEQFARLAVAVNTGTNIPSVATPNGQAAFLFLLTSALARLIRLGYGRMLWMALPYTATMTVTGLAAVAFWP